jgi:Ca-activated chloride channel family protein
MLQSLTGVRIPLRRVKLNGTAEGSLFTLTVEQHYKNVEDEAIEAVYSFPLPLRAVLLSFELELAGRKLSGIVRQKREASEQYEEALQNADSAALLEQARDGLYTVSVGNLLPGEEAVIRYRYGQLLDLEQGRVRIAIPTAVAPRYGNAERAVDAHQVPGVDVTAEYYYELAFTVRGSLAQATVASPTHTLVEAKTDSIRTFTLCAPAALDRDLVILIGGLEAQATGIVSQDHDGYVALASVTAPSMDLAARGPRTLKLVVDCSGSMAGDSMTQARAALLAVLSTLTPEDCVSVTRFGSRVEHVTRGLKAATPALLLNLDDQVRRMEADLGGTELGGALDASLALASPSGVTADVILITDGEIWQIDEVIQRLAEATHRLFVIAVGSSPVEELARKVTETTGGACEFVTPGEDMRGAIGRILARMGTPTLTVTSVEWSVPPDWIVGIGQVVFPGDTVHIVAGFGAKPAGDVRVSIGGKETAKVLTLMLPPSIAPDDTLSRVAAARRLRGMPREAAAQLAEKYQLITPYTSCVVVLERAAGEKGTANPSLRSVPQMLAAGWGATSQARDSSATCLDARPPLRFMRGAPHASVTDNFAPRFSHRLRRRKPGDDMAPSRPPAKIDSAWVSAEFDRLLSESASSEPQSVSHEGLNLIERLRTGGPLPTTLDDLAALGVSGTVLDCLRAMVGQDYREQDLIAAWLAIFAASDEGKILGWRFRRRIARASDRVLRKRVLEALTATHVP